MIILDFFENEIIVSKIIMAFFISKDNDKPIQNDTETYGLVYNVDCDTVYRFETGEILTCHSGECIYLPKGTDYTAKRYSVRDTDKCGVYAINFLTISEEDTGTPFVIRIRNKEEIVSLFSKAEKLWQKKIVGFQEECFACLYRIIRIIKQELSANYFPKKSTLETIKPAIEYIYQNYTLEHISLSHLAELCSISEPYLRRLFHNVFMTSPSVYIRNLRIKYAKELIRSKQYSITDVAILSGFNNPSYFSREFKKAEGISPKEYAET